MPVFFCEPGFSQRGIRVFGIVAMLALVKQYRLQGRPIPMPKSHVLNRDYPLKESMPCHTVAVEAL